MRKRDVAAIRFALDIEARLKTVDTEAENMLSKGTLTGEEAGRCWVRKSTLREIDRMLAKLEQAAE